MHNVTESERVDFWLTLYAGFAVSVLVFAVVGRFLA